MAIVWLLEWDGITVEQYDELRDRIGWGLLPAVNTLGLRGLPPALINIPSTPSRPKVIRIL
jgi:hypothetical protein